MTWRASTTAWWRPSGGAALPGPETLPRSVRALCRRPAHPLRRGSGYTADLDGLAVDLARVHERPGETVTGLKGWKSDGGRFVGYWEVRFRMRNEHTIRYERKAFPFMCLLKVDGKLVWRSKRLFNRLPTADVAFRIENEDADCWLVLKDHSSKVLLKRSVAVWVDNTRVLHFRD